MKEFKKSTPTFIGILFLVLFIFINGCKKINNETEKYSDGKDIPLVRSAKNYFEILLNKEGKIQVQAPGKKQTGISPRIDPLSKMNSYVLWDQSIYKKSGGLEYVIIPLKEKIKPFKNKSYEFFRDIIFYEGKNKTPNMTIMEVLSKKNESLGNDLNKIAVTAFENKNFSRNDNVDKIDASVIFYDQSYKQEGSYQLKDGKWGTARVLFRSDLEITQ